MNQFEKKSFIISFLVFFSLQTIFISFINYQNYKTYRYLTIDKISKQFQICSYKLNCKKVNTDFVDKKKGLKLLTLLTDKNDVYMLFELSYLKKYYLKLSLNKQNFDKEIEKIKKKVFKNFLIELIFVFVFSIIFSLYLLKPLKEAYKLNETFIKDILHDFNTPLSSIKLNIYMLKKEFKNNKKVDRINESLNIILNLQQNLKSFIENNNNQIETFNIKELIDEKIKFYKTNYPSILIKNKIKKLEIKTNKTAFERIIDNIISNSFKYNKQNGKISLKIENNNLIIYDTGKGIKNPKKIFDRFYKENERGIGIGMNIVKKLSDELNIKIEIESELGKWTEIKLNLNEVIKR